MTVLEPRRDPFETSVERRLTLARGVFWIGLFRWTAQLLSWGITLFVIRILSPEDYGILGMTTYFIGLASVLGEFGIGAAVLAVPELSPTRSRQLNTLALGVSGGAFLLAAAAAAPIGWYFREPALVPVLIVLGATLLVDGVRTVPVALLNRELQYRKASSVDFVRAIVSSIAVLTLALLGLHYWSLVFGALAGSLAASAWALRLRPVGFERPRQVELRDPVKAGSHILVSRLAWQGYQNADFLVAGRLLGAIPLGFYNVGWTIASLPGEKLTNILTAVTLPFFASIRQDLPALRGYFRRLTFLLCLVLWPVLFGFVLVADLMIPAVLGSQWAPAVPVTRALVFYAAFQSPLILANQILVVTGRTGVGMRASLLALAILPPAFYLSGQRWGIEGIAWTWAVMYPIINIWPLTTALRQLGTSLWTYLGALAHAGIFVAGMSVAVLLVRFGLPDGVRVRQELILAVVTGAASYGLLLWMGARNDVRSLRALLVTWRAEVGRKTD